MVMGQWVFHVEDNCIEYLNLRENDASDDLNVVNIQPKLLSQFIKTLTVETVPLLADLNCWPVFYHDHLVVLCRGVTTQRERISNEGKIVLLCKRLNEDSQTT